MIHTLEIGRGEYPGITLPALLTRTTDLTKAGQRKAINATTYPDKVKSYGHD